MAVPGYRRNRDGPGFLARWPDPGNWLGLQSNWTICCGEIPSVDINTDRIIQRYAEIDAYSQGKDPIRAIPPGVTSRNMGKNDLWIAATTSVVRATLITTDKDFDHLNGLFLDLVYIDPKWRSDRPD